MPSIVLITEGAEEQGEFTFVQLNLDYLYIFSAASPHTMKCQRIQCVAQ